MDRSILTRIRDMLPNTGLTCGSVQTIQEISYLINPILSHNEAVEFVLQIPQQNIKIHLCNLIYDQQQINRTLDLSLYLYVITILLAAPGRSHAETLLIYNVLDTIIDHENTEEADLLQIFDIMVTYYPLRSQRMHDILQNRHININQQINVPPQIFNPGYIHPNQQNPVNQNPNVAINQNIRGLKQKITVYDDTQNVHTTSINKSVINACETLLKKYPPLIICKKLCHDERSEQPSELKLSFQQIRRIPNLININWLLFDTIETIKTKLSSEINIHYDDIIIGVDEKNQDDNGDINYTWITNDMNDIPKISKILKKSHKKIIIKNDINLIPNLVFIYDKDNIRSTTCQNIDNEILSFITNVFQDLFQNTIRYKNLIHRIRFSAVRDIKIYDILNCVWKYIFHHIYKEELQLRLIEELKDADGVCSTGILSRIINSFQGFITETEDTSLNIQLDIKNELIGKLSHIINKKALRQEIDPICDPVLFRKIIEDIINNEFENINKEYKEIRHGEIQLKWIQKIMDDVYKI